jgi:hypothetical protein
MPTCHIHMNLSILRDFALLPGYLLICGYFDLVFRDSESKDHTDKTEKISGRRVGQGRAKESSFNSDSFLKTGIFKSLLDLALLLVDTWRYQFYSKTQ